MVWNGQANPTKELNNLRLGGSEEEHLLPNRVLITTGDAECPDSRQCADVNNFY
jgi:hypothetical protein